jgi:hypothetical protein
MDRRQDQVVIVLAGRASLVAGRCRRIERQLGQEALARRMAAGEADEMGDVGGASFWQARKRHVRADGAELAPARATPVRALGGEQRRRHTARRGVGTGKKPRRPRRLRRRATSRPALAPVPGRLMRKPARWPRGGRETKRGRVPRARRQAAVFHERISRRVSSKPARCCARAPGF